MADEVVWVNGSVVPAGEATVSVFDHGITVGDGVFETLKAVEGAAFAVRRHLLRLRRSAAALGLEVPVDDAALRAAIEDVLADAPRPLARVRITLTGGPAPLGSERGRGPATVVVAAADLEPSPPSTSVCVVPWPRNERGALAGVKSTSYAENVMALSYARARGCTEALFLTTTGLLSEGTGSNVFAVIDGRLVTPPLSSGCLAGITRELVLEVTDAVEADVTAAELESAEEVLLTSTGRDVQAVHRVGDRRLDAPGPLTMYAADAFAAVTRRTTDP